MDRFILGSILTMTAVAYYTTPYEVVTRFGIISGGFMGVMFPAFSVSSLNNKDELAALHQRSIRFLLFIFLPLAAFLIISANPILYFWLGREFAQNSTLVMQILTLGIVINSIARVPSTVIQAVGRPDIRAKLHMAELPVYLMLIWMFTQQWGIIGVALAWVVRVLIDGVFLLYFTNNIIEFMPRNRHNLYRQMWGYLAFISTVTLVLLVVDNRFALVGIGIFVAMLTLYLSWLYMLKESERDQIIQLCKRMQVNVLKKMK